jgi:RND family efflux transporter MFP subunit
MKRTWLIVLWLAVGCGRKESAPPVAEAPPVTVQTAVVRSQPVPDLYEVIGTVRPKVGATISAKVMATILQIPVKPGEAIKAGEVLAQLDDREMRAAFERARADYERYQKLLEHGAAPLADFQTVEEHYRLAQTALSYATITAPFDGIVTEKLCEVGDLAAPAKALFNIEQPANYRLEAYVPDRFGSAVAVGTPVHVIVDAVGGEYDAVVGEVIPVGDPASRSFLIKADLPRCKPLKSGLFGRAQIVVGTRNGLLAPKTAVHERGQLVFVFVVQDGHARMRLVKSGKTVGDQVDLLAGVEAGDRLVSSAEGELTDGRRVEVQ